MLFPVKSIPLSYFLFLFLFHSHFSSDPFVLTNTFQHASEMWLILWWKKDPLRTTVLTFILMMNLESFPDETFITLNVFCWGGNWPEKHRATTCIYSTLTSLLPISVKHLWVILPTFLAYNWCLKSDIWISDMCIYIYVANEPSSQDILK